MEVKERKVDDDRPEIHLAKYTIKDLQQAIEKFKPICTESYLADSDAPFKFGLGAHTDEAIDALIAYIGRTGNVITKWMTIRPIILWKCEAVNAHMKAKYPSPERTAELEEQWKNIGLHPDWMDVQNTHDRVMKQLESFDGYPFTYQRLCEVLHEPTRYYKGHDKYLRGIEKLVTVSTTYDLPTKADENTNKIASGEPSSHVNVSNVTHNNGYLISRNNSELPIADTPDEKVTGVDPTKQGDGMPDPEVASAMNSGSVGATECELNTPRPGAPTPPTSEMSTDQKDLPLENMTEEQEDMES